MNCPNCVSESLEHKYTRQGVEINACKNCGGIWLEEGEIFHFTKQPVALTKALDRAISQARPSERLSPKTGEEMHEVPLFGEDLVIDMCPQTQGLWFDGGELKKLRKARPRLLTIAFDESAGDVEESGEDRRMRRETIVGMGLPRLPSLFFRSVATLVLLYVILALVLITLVEFAGLPPQLAVGIGVGFALVQFLLGPVIMDLSLRWFYTMDWITPKKLPAHLSKFVEQVCEKSNMKFPRFGLIRDGAPNAFTYGHIPSNARIIITQGVLDLLDEKEVEGVVAHEIGHAKHWDMLLMTVAQLVPLVLYFLYRSMVRVRTKGEGKGAQYREAIAIGAYVLYIISQYVVLWFSRTREYHADRFAGEVTGRPNDLATGLVKIAYGLAGQEKTKKEKEEKEEKVERSVGLEAIGAMGIFDPGVARALAITSHMGAVSDEELRKFPDKTALLGAMRWDLWNPWAKFYELNSTHPLVANRLNYLGEQAVAMDQEPYVVFNLRRPESYWDEFFIDLIMLLLPILAFIGPALIALFTGQSWLFGVAFMAMGAAMIGKIFFSHPRKVFPKMSVAGLLRKVKVSGVRSVPATLKGRIIGRGVPGLIWSEDFVMKDETGIIFLDYRQPIRLWEFFFGLMRGQELQDKEAEVTGWYRRSPVPYVELDTLTVNRKTRRCYVYHIRIVVAVLLIVGGFIGATQAGLPLA